MDNETTLTKEYAIAKPLRYASYGIGALGTCAFAVEAYTNFRAGHFDPSTLAPAAITAAIFFGFPYFSEVNPKGAVKQSVDKMLDMVSTAIDKIIGFIIGAIVIGIIGSIFLGPLLYILFSLSPLMLMLFGIFWALCLNIPEPSSNCCNNKSNDYDDF